MLYQKILNENTPYMLKVGQLNYFQEHRHADVEIYYCMEGELNVIINKREHFVKKGDIAIVLPMQSHSIVRGGKNKVLVSVFGVALLKKFFSRFTQKEFESSVYSLTDIGEDKILKNILEQTSNLTQSSGDVDELLIISNLYRLCAFILDKLCAERQEKIQDFTLVQGVEKALDLVYYNYFEPITVEDGALATGYGKSNFCKIFKKVTGYTFHDFLNKRRVEVALGLLSESNMTVTEISQEVGFTEAKTFCRVFRQIMGVTPLKYKKQKKGTSK